MYDFQTPATHSEWSVKVGSFPPEHEKRYHGETIEHPGTEAEEVDECEQV